MIIRVIILIGLSSVLYSCNNKYAQFHKCIDNNEYMKSVTNEKYYKSKYNIHQICNSFETVLLKKHWLNGTKKQDYINFILTVNNASKLEKIRNIINFSLGFDKQEFITSFKQNQNLLLCMRHKTNLENIEIKNYFKIISKMQNFEEKLNFLLIKLINNFDNDFYYDKKNRCLILYQILFIYSDSAHFKCSEIINVENCITDKNKS